MAYAADAVTTASQTPPSGTNAGELHFDAALKLWTFMRQDGTFALLGAAQPAYCGVSMPAAPITSTTPGNVADARAVPAASLNANTILEVTIRAFLTGTNNSKNLLFGIDADLSNALTATFAAAQTGIVTFAAQFLVKAASPHLLVSRADFNSQFGFAIKRGTVAVNLATTAINLQTQAWVANASDSITIDSVSVTQKGLGL